MRTRGQDPTLPEMRRVRLLEMADAMDMGSPQKTENKAR